jgi:hypothetical protein
LGRRDTSWPAVQARNPTPQRRRDPSAPLKPFDLSIRQSLSGRIAVVASDRPTILLTERAAPARNLNEALKNRAAAMLLCGIQTTGWRKAPVRPDQPPHFD